ncbi:MAG: radical SAM protein [Gemmatimonadota bacterium]
MSATQQSAAAPRLDPGKFQDPLVTADGSRRAFVELGALTTLWFNTGTLCNIECRSCYIESSPRNDRLAYLTLDEVCEFLDELGQLDLTTREIGFTGGEPFMNPEFIGMLEETLGRGLRALVLTNAMQPLQRPRIRTALLGLRERHGDRLTLRVSLDHYTRELHGLERGPGSWPVTLRGLGWLSEHGFHLHVAGRTCWGESEAEARAGYARLFAAEGIPVDARNPTELVLFPEMDESADVPEITTGCWAALGKRPEDVMCASSRMVVRRKGAERPVVLPCTLLPYGREFELGDTLGSASKVVYLNHPHCARFCVLGGGSCSVGETR